MKKIESFKELKSIMINPLNNPDFYALLLGDDRYRVKPKSVGHFSLCNSYDIGCSNKNDYYTLWHIIIDQYLKNVDYKRFIECYPNSTLESFENVKKLLLNALASQNNLENFIKRNINSLRKMLGIVKDLEVDNGGWFYFKSQYLNPNLDADSIRLGNIKHRLYLTADSNSRVCIANKIIEKCNQKNLPYNFKILMDFRKNVTNRQSDTVVIYLTDEIQVVEYINFINDIIDENEELKKHIFKPSPHLGIINDYLGYGFEPNLHEERLSYSALLREAVKNISFESIANNILQYSGQEQSKELMELLNRPKKEPEEYEKIKKFFSEYFISENMDTLEIKNIKKQFIDGILNKYPQLPRDNMFGIDTDKFKSRPKEDESFTL